MKRIAIRCLLVLCWLAPTLAGADGQQELLLDVGEQRVIPSEGVTSYSEGIPGIVDVRLTKDGSSFVLVGQRAGKTSLLLMRRDGERVQYRIVVGAPQTAAQDAPDEMRIEARDNIRLDFYFVQLSRDGSSRAGIDWPASYGGGSLNASVDLLDGSFNHATAMVTEQALPRLDMAQSSGWAKLLRQAAVITRNGTEATFSGGGELNIQVQNAVSVGLQQVRYGSEVRVLPRYDRESGRLELVIHASVSDLATDHGSGVPGLITSKLDSVVNLELGQSLVLAGLTASSETESRRGLPGLSQIPILGMLFGTHHSRSEQTENLIFIVPSVVDAVSSDTRDRLREAVRVFHAYDGDLEDEGLPVLDTLREGER